MSTPVSKLSPKPIIASVLQTWNVPPGLKIALVEDMERHLWIVESCPAGTHFWTLPQAQALTHSGRVGAALRAALSTAQQLPVIEKPVSKKTNSPVPLAVSESVPDKTLKREQRFIETTYGATRPLRRASRRSEKVAVCS